MPNESSEQIDLAKITPIESSDPLNLPITRITPENIEAVWKQFDSLFSLFNLISSPDEAMRDYFACAQAGPDDAESYSLFPESVFHHHVMHKTIKAIFSSENMPVFTPGQSRLEVLDQITAYFYQLGEWSQLWQVFLQKIATIPWGKDFIEYINTFWTFAQKDWLKLLTPTEQQRYGDLYKQIFIDQKPGKAKKELWDEYIKLDKKVSAARTAAEKTMKLALEKFELVSLQLAAEKHGRNFKNMDEVSLYESSLRLQAQLPRLVQLSSSREIREELARSHATDTFCHMVANDISPNNPMKTEAMHIFDQMIVDFISNDPAGLWPFLAKQNFSHDLFRSAEAESMLDKSKNTKIYADAIIDALEELLDRLNEVLSTKNDNSLIESELNSTQQSYSVLQRTYGYTKNSLVVKYREQEMDAEVESFEDSKLRWFKWEIVHHCEGYLVKLFLTELNPTHPDYSFSYCAYGYTKDHPLVKAIQSRWEKMQTVESWLEGNKDTYRKMLMDIEAFCFCVPRKIGISLEQAYREAVLHSKKARDYLLPTIEPIVENKINKQLEKFKEIVKCMISQRTKNGDFQAVLGIGFEGSLFNQVKFSRVKKNKVYLAFSNKACTEWHYFLLKLLADKLFKKFDDDKIQIKVVRKDGFKASILKRNKRVSSLNNKKIDKNIYAYILNIILRTILINKDHELNKNLVEIWLAIIIDIIKTSKLEKRIKEELIAKCSNQNVTEEDYKNIFKVVLDEQHFGCAEALLSKYGSTNNYIPVIFLPEHKDQVRVDNNLVYAGTNQSRPIICPCFRCRLLSVPYLLWAILYRGWGLGDLNMGAELSGRQPIQPRFPLYYYTGLSPALTTEPYKGIPFKRLSDMSTSRLLVNNSAIFTGQGNALNSADRQWYTNEQMVTLLNFYIGSNNNVSLLAPINVDQIEERALVWELQSALLKWLGVMHIEKIIVPINLGDLHWTALYIYFGSTDRTRPIVDYFDPYAEPNTNPMPNFVSTALRGIYFNVKFKSKQVCPVYLKEENDKADCGPWLIAILEAFVKKGYFPEENFDIELRRKQDMEILHDNSAALAKMAIN